MSIEWTPERTNALIALWDEGLTTAEIGRRLGTTKNAVVGKAHRLVLPKRAPSRPRAERPSSSGTVVRAPARRVSTQTPRPAPPPVAKEPLPDPDKVVCLEGLTHGMCAWPIGDPGDPNFRFCGRDAAPGKPYCAGHCTVAYVRVSRDRESRAA